MKKIRAQALASDPSRVIAEVRICSACLHAP